MFPHHENEIAQSEAVSGKKFAKYWMHNAFLNIDNVKMSKSLGNFKTVRQISEQYDLQILRLFMLSAHYRSPLNFSAEMMESAKASLERILTCMERLKDLAGKVQERELNAAEEETLKSLETLVQKFESSMEDDFNTADALSAVFEMVKLANVSVTEESAKELVSRVDETLRKLLDVLGILPERKKETLDAEVEALIAERQAARKARNFARADEIRNQLTEMGILLEDTREGVKWKRA